MTDAESALARYRAVNPDDTGARVLNPGDEGYPTNAQWDEASQAYVAPVEPDYPIRAFHGSPHSFDQFSLDKIGTGEGAQAYGHGLYFAESEDVARSYRDALTNKAPPASAQSGIDRAAFNVVRSSVDGGLGLPDDQLAAYVRQPYPDATDEEVLAAIANARQSLQPGSMYEVGINAHPDTFLDWDRPLSEQPAIAERLGWTPDAMEAYRASTRSDTDALLAALDGGSDYAPTRAPVPEGLPPLSRTGAEVLGGNQLFGRADDPAKSARLRELGINGVRYRDGFSRGREGEGSSNYVVFNDELVRILRKYGMTGVGFGLGASALSSRYDDSPPPPIGL
jgi:hypothetical protein